MPIKEYKLGAEERESLLKKIPPKYTDVVADHITYEYSTKVTPYSLQTPPQKNNIEIIGVADDGNGLQALVARLDGKLEKEGNSIYHITWSLDRDKDVPKEYAETGVKKYKPVHSNHLVKNLIDYNGNRLLPDNSSWKLELFNKPIKINPDPVNVLLASDRIAMSNGGRS